MKNTGRFAILASCSELGFLGKKDLSLHAAVEDEVLSFENRDMPVIETLLAAAPSYKQPLNELLP